MSNTIEVHIEAKERLSCVDLTDELKRAIKDSGVVEGCAVVFCAHTTCALVINEWEEGVLEDLRARLDVLVPKDVYYAHDDFERRTQNLQEDERVNGHAHVMQMLVGGTSHAIPVSSSEPVLGTWQRLFLLEFDEPKQRTVIFHVFGG